MLSYGEPTNQSATAEFVRNMLFELADREFLIHRHCGSQDFVLWHGILEGGG